MNKSDQNKIAEGVFKKRPNVTECFVATDGNVFLSNNAAELHKNTNPTGKKVDYVRVENSSVVAVKENKTTKTKALSAMTKAELEKAAEGLVDISEAKNNQERAELIRIAQEEKALLVKLPQMNEADLKVLAENKGIRPEEGTSKEDLIKLIEGVINADIKE